MNDSNPPDKRWTRLDYPAYLQTDHWKTMKRMALDWAEGTCMICLSPDRPQVHHRTYARLGRERLSDLIVLCEECHSIFHGKMASPEQDTWDAIARNLGAA